MTTWDEFASEAPGLAAAVRACFEVRKHATMATLRADGSPRISGLVIESWHQGRGVQKVLR